MLNSFEAMKLPLKAALAFNQAQMQSVAAGFDIVKNTQDLANNLTRRHINLLIPGLQQNGDMLMKLYQEWASSLLDLFKENYLRKLNRFHQRRANHRQQIG